MKARLGSRFAALLPLANCATRAADLAAGGSTFARRHRLVAEALVRLAPRAS
jgi:hypothetical protein